MAKSYDPIAPIAEEISEEACLLCFKRVLYLKFLLYFSSLIFLGSWPNSWELAQLTHGITQLYKGIGIPSGQSLPMFM